MMDGVESSRVESSHTRPNSCGGDEAAEWAWSTARVSCDWEVDVVEVVFLVDRGWRGTEYGEGQGLFRIYGVCVCVCVCICPLSGCPATKGIQRWGVYRWCAVQMQLVVRRRQIATRLPLAAADCSQATPIVCLLLWGGKSWAGAAWLTGMHLQCMGFVCASRLRITGTLFCLSSSSFQNNATILFPLEYICLCGAFC